MEEEDEGEEVKGGSAIFFFFNEAATTEIYTIALHDALPILKGSQGRIICQL